MVRTLLVLLACGSVALGHRADAQGALFGSNPPIGIAIKVSPPYPRPGDTVTAEVQTSAVDSSTALVTWKVNGVVIKESSGGTSCSFTAGKLGEVMRITVLLRDTKGTAIEATNVLQVADVALVWEAKSYTPPFFGGRARYAPGTPMTILALPSVMGPKGVLLDPTTLMYAWYMNKSFTPDVAGKGLQSVTLTNNVPFGEFDIFLEVKDDTGTIRTTKRLVVDTAEPQLVLYEDDPLTGVSYHRALGDAYRIRAAEATLIAEPYYLSALSRSDPALTYAWQVGDQDFTTIGSLVLRPEGKGAGSAEVSLLIQHTNIWQQRVSAGTTVSFDTAAVQPATSFTP